MYAALNDAILWHITPYKATFYRCNQLLLMYHGAIAFLLAFDNRRDQIYRVLNAMNCASRMLHIVQHPTVAS